MGECEGTVTVDHEERGHSAKLQYFPLLAVELSQLSVLIGNTDHGEVFLLPVGVHFFRAVRRDDDDRGVSRSEFLEILFHLSQMLSGVRSAESTEKDKHDGALLPKCRQGYLLAVI